MTHPETDMDSGWDGGRVTVCAGPPACLLTDEAAVSAASAGCVWCRRIYIGADGREHETGPAHA